MAKRTTAAKSGQRDAASPAPPATTKRGRGTERPARSAQEHVRAPAKINLMLRIVGRRRDGYHLLDSLMLPVSLYDDIMVTARFGDGASIEVASDSESAPGGPANLAHGAALAFLNRIGSAGGADVQLRKRIPVGSGLGGGSSDAAAVLLALNRLFGCPLAVDELARMGLEIGADVPFFIHGCPARVGGIGEQVAPIDFPRSLPLVLCWDHHSLSTREVYARAGVSLTSAAALSNIIRSASGKEPSWGALVNDLEPAAAQIHPEVLTLKEKLIARGALGALMTGSGGAVFGVWPDAQSARRVALQLRRQGLWAESVQTLALSPAVRS
jgi:4-diphosphocytidyl-2-C-methyl-D-erythritol kinase